MATVLQLSPSVVCFQEVVGPFIRILQRSKEINARYQISPNRIERYGVLTLVKHELQPTFEEVHLPSRMGRNLLLASMGGLAVGNVHLESLDNEPTRAQQLAQCEQAMKTYDTAILVGTRVTSMR